MICGSRPRVAQSVILRVQFLPLKYHFKNVYIVSLVAILMMITLFFSELSYFLTTVRIKF